MSFFETKWWVNAVLALALLNLSGMCPQNTAHASAASADRAQKTTRVENGNTLFLRAKKYHDGDGDAQDYGKARALYQRAAELGSTDAKVNLGYLYFVGLGVKQDYIQAINWYLPAAQMGDKDAQLNLSLMYEHGLGVTKNKTRAQYWRNKSTAKNAVKTTPARKPQMAGKSALPAKDKPKNMSPKTKLTAQLNTNEYPQQKTQINNEPISTIVLSSVKPMKTIRSFEPAMILAPWWTSHILGLIMLALALMSSVWFVRQLFKQRRRQMGREFIIAFYEHYGDSLRISYLRYPLGHKFTQHIQTPWSTALCVLLVRFALDNVERDANKSFEKKSTRIADKLRHSPFAARQYVFPLIDSVQRRILSDIKRTSHIQIRNEFDFRPATKQELQNGQNRKQRTNIKIPPTVSAPKLHLVR